MGSDDSPPLRTLTGYVLAGSFSYKKKGEPTAAGGLVPSRLWRPECQPTSSPLSAGARRSDLLDWLSSARKAVTTVGSTLLCAELLPTRNAAIRSVHLSDYRLAISTLG